MDNVELIITVRCKICGDIVSVNAGLESDDEKKEAKGIISKFADAHRHTPWVI